MHSQFLNMWGEQDQRRKGFKLLSSYFLANLKPPAALPCKNQLTPHLFLNVLMGVSQISVVVSNSPWMMELFLAGTLSGVGCSSPVGLASTGMGPAENINVCHQDCTSLTTSNTAELEILVQSLSVRGRDCNGISKSL